MVSPTLHFHLFDLLQLGSFVDHNSVYFLGIKESINIKIEERKYLCCSLAVVFVSKRKLDQRNTFATLKFFDSVKLPL